MKQSPIFTKAHDLLLWLLPQTAKFPREQRFVLTQAVQQSALRLQERLIEAGMSKGSERVALLHQADIELVKLKERLRLCQEMKLLTVGQYGYASQMTLEVGKLLGAWLARETKQTASAGDRPAAGMG
jgi:cytosine/adenosine deaminase-related metal-dependent hydrolase